MREGLNHPFMRNRLDVPTVAQILDGNRLKGACSVPTLGVTQSAQQGVAYPTRPANSSVGRV